MKGEKFYTALISEFLSLTSETEWVEFKVDNAYPAVIGEYISALSNSATLVNKDFAYIVWGIDNATHAIVGTNFDFRNAKMGGENIENWLSRSISPSIGFEFIELLYLGKKVVLLEIQKATIAPIAFQNIEYIRLGSYKKKLKDHREKERELWKKFDMNSFEDGIAMANLSESDVLKYLDYPAYFDLLSIPLPENRIRIIESLVDDNMVIKNDAGLYDILNLGAILFAKNINQFKSLSRKAIRVIHYKSTNRIKTINEQIGVKGYASGFSGLIDFIDNLIPRNEEIGKSLRKEVPMYPELSIRELIANAIIHQDFSISGAGAMIEIFSDRIEITNPGIPLVDKDRFLDAPPRSRNERLASFMRRIGVCEERGSGFDKVIHETELYQLKPPIITTPKDHTKVTMFSYSSFKDMNKIDKIRACYYHACLKYVSNSYMTNSSLRERFKLPSSDVDKISRLIKVAVTEEVIKLRNPETSSRYYEYVPYWE